MKLLGAGLNRTGLTIIIEQELGIKFEAYENVCPESLPELGRVTWAVPTVLESIRIDDKQLIGIAPQPFGVGSDLLSQDQIVEPMLPNGVVHCEQSPNPYRGAPLRDSDCIRDLSVLLRHIECIEIGDVFKDPELW